MKLAILGYGAVASVHVRQLSREPGVTLASVFGPDREKAARFAADHGIKCFSDSMEEALAAAEGAIVCSPTSCHFEQARKCLELGKHTLVELPPCADSGQARELDRISRDGRLTLRCAHTSRYLMPYKAIASWIRAGRLGRILQVNYLRHHVPRSRSWSDDALFHHAAHPLDLMLDWFGEISPAACVCLPSTGATQNVSLLGRLPGGAPAAISISYTSRLPHSRMLLVGEEHTVETDGFSYARSDSNDFALTAEQEAVYEQAIHDQDLEFVRACRGENVGVDWGETVKLMQCIDRFFFLSKWERS